MSKWKFMGYTTIPGRMPNSWFWTDGEEFAYIDMDNFDESDIIDVPPRSAYREVPSDYGFDNVVEVMDDWDVVDYQLD